MTFAIQPVTSAGIPPAGNTSSNTSAPAGPASYPTAFGHSSDTYTPQEGSRSNFGLLTGALTCCALPFFALGALVALAGVAAVRRSFSTVKGLSSLPSAFQGHIG